MKRRLKEKTGERLDTREIYPGRTIHVAVDKVRLPNGKVMDLELVHHQGAVVAAQHVHAGHPQPDRLRRLGACGRIAPDGEDARVLWPGRDGDLPAYIAKAAALSGHGVLAGLQSHLAPVEGAGKAWLVSPSRSGLRPRNGSA